jgi:CNT family concentrative nucleoside transporter
MLLLDIVYRLQGLLGIVVLLGLAWAMSNNRRKVPWRILGFGLGLQVLFGLIVLKTELGKGAFDLVRRAANRLLSFSDAGAGFVFGNLYKGIPSPVSGEPGWSLSLIDPATSNPVQMGFVVAFHVLPVIIFFSSLLSILYHIGVMQRLVAGFAWVMRRTMKISGAESLATAANIFVGNVESPLAVRPYIEKMTTSELALIMTSGFATVAGSVMATYIRFGVDAGHLLSASIMSAPAAVMVAKLMFPETAIPQTADGTNIRIEKETTNIIDAAATGAFQGLKIAATVGAMLIAFLSLVAMINFFLGFAGTSLGELFGYLFSPIAFCMGVDKSDVLRVGALLGTKVAINEFVAYLDLIAIKEQISERSFVIGTYALCGFANFGSIGIALGGIGQIAPGRRADLARLGLKTMFGGALASWITASIAGMLI